MQELEKIKNLAKDGLPFNKLEELLSLPEDGSPGREIGRSERPLNEKEIDARYKAGLYFYDKDKSESYRAAIRDYIKIEDLPAHMSNEEKHKLFTERLKNYLEKRYAMETHSTTKPSLLDPLLHMTTEESNKDTRLIIDIKRRY